MPGHLVVGHRGGQVLLAVDDRVRVERVDAVGGDLHGAIGLRLGALRRWCGCRRRAGRHYRAEKDGTAYGECAKLDHRELVGAVDDQRDPGCSRVRGRW
ncbi:hypothetical protein GCM10009727_25860 [Actinomadura napierensis]|uniref:Uncharacterized protein n=1 Tax=Actinomadura napierensis TaxID=267854 RepID=A0ABP5KIK2_9ACTN